MSLYSETGALAAFAKISDPLSGRDIVSAGRLGNVECNTGFARAILLVDPNKPQSFEPARKAMEDALLGFTNVTKASVLMTAHKAAPVLKAPEKKPKTPHQARRPDGHQGDAQQTIKRKGEWLLRQ